MRVAEIGDDRAQAWDDYVFSAADATFYHQYRWRRALRGTYGLRTWYLAAEEEDGRIRGVLPLAEIPGVLGRGVLLSLPYGNYGGVLADSAEARDALLGDARHRLVARRGKYLELKQPRRCDTPLLVDKLHYHSLELELTADPDVIWRERMNAKVRNQVRKATKSGLSAVSGPEHLPGFISVYRRNQRDLGTPTHSLRWFNLLAELFGDRMGVVLVLADGRPVAGGWLFFFRDTAVLHAAASLAEHRERCPNNLVYWEAIALCCRRGCRVLDFARSRVGSGSYHFKQQWGAVPRQTYYQYMLNAATRIPDMDPVNPRFAAAIALWRRLPLPLANVLGPLLRWRITT